MKGWKEPSRVDVELATRQVSVGHPVYIPEDNPQACMEDILTRFCGLTKKAAADFLVTAADQGIDERWMIPQLTPEVLRLVFALTVGQALCFVRTARWIAVQDELRALPEPPEKEEEPPCIVYGIAIAEDGRNFHCVMVNGVGFCDKNNQGFLYAEREGSCVVDGKTYTVRGSYEWEPMQSYQGVTLLTKINWE